MRGAHAAHDTPTVVMGKATIVLAALGMASVLWMWWMTAGSVDPPDWLRVGGHVFIPVGILGALGTGTVGMLTDSGRRLSQIGLLLAALDVVAFVVVYNAYA